MKNVIIIGAGPAGLSAAYELLKKSNIKPIIIESNSKVGGLSKTLTHNGYKIDIGPHRFFSKNQIVNNLWQEILPIKKDNKTQGSFLIIKRLTRILFLKKFFDYPINLNFKTLKNLGNKRVVKIFFSYLKIKIKPIKKEISLSDFLTNRFGKILYLTFFKDYTEKVWGVSCDKIPKEWGAQRIKGLSIKKIMFHYIKTLINFKNTANTETSLIDEFFYPEFGAGQMYEEMAKKIIKMGGKIILNQKVIKIKAEKNKIYSIKTKNLKNDEIIELKADYFISSMPIKNLITNLEYPTPQEIIKIAKKLPYRDYIIIGLLFEKMIIKNNTKIITKNNIIPDNWLYIQEKNIKMGRLDIFNNFSKKMLKNENLIWIGAEYFCNQGDELWKKNNLSLKNLAVEELEKINFIKKEDLLDYKVIKIKKAYPAYFGSYNKFDILKNFLNDFSNLFLIGRNGTHRYNNMDHSILSGLTAANNIINNKIDKNNIWEINTEEEYHENKK